MRRMSSLLDPSSPTAFSAFADDDGYQSSAETTPTSARRPKRADEICVGGHHLTIQRDGVFMKESCSRREERFYEMVRPVQEFAAQNPELLSALCAPSLLDFPSSGVRDNRNNNNNNGNSNSNNSNSSHSVGEWGVSEVWQGERERLFAAGGDAAVSRWFALWRLLPFVPRFYGIRWVHLSLQETSRQMIVLEDICHTFTHACVLDVKMGSRQYGLNPTDAKRRSKERKSVETTSMQYGVRLAGMRRWCAESKEYETQSKLDGRRLSLHALRETLHRFLQRQAALRAVFRARVGQLREAFVAQRVFRFFTSSLLFVYDADAPIGTARVVMVDFAYTYDHEELRRGGDPDAEVELDVGYIKALDTLLELLE